MLIYQIVHIETGYKYIGQTTRLPIRRWREHLYSLRKRKHHNRYLQAAWNKYGEQAFKFEIIKECNSLSDLNQFEVELIRNSNDLFNLADGGNAHTHLTITRRQIGEANKKPIVGMNIQTKEIKKYNSAKDAEKDGFRAACIRKCVLGSIANKLCGKPSMSVSHKGWVWTKDSTGYEVKLTELTKIAKRAKIRKERPIIGLSILTEEIRMFRSASEAARNGFNLTTIRRCCLGEIKIHKGFTWVFGDIANPQSLLQEKRKMIRENPPKTGPKSWQ